jgi:predicted aspartyl protease
MKHAKPAFSYQFTNGSSAANISFELNSNKPFVPIYVNETGPRSFLVDTGSISTVVDTDLASSLGLSEGDAFESSGAGEGSITGNTCPEVALALAGLDFTTGPIDVLPINRAISFAEGHRVDGLLGYDFFANFVVVLDYAAQRMRIVDKEPDPHDNERATNIVSLPLEMVRGHPFVSAEVVTSEGKRLRGRFLIDTGWRSALSLNAPFVARNHLLDATRTIKAVTGVGVGGPTVEAVGRVDKFHLGLFAIQSPITNFSSAKAGILSQSDMTGIIGGEILRRFTVAFDYPRKRMLLEPNDQFARSYEFDMSGLMVTAEGDDFKTFRVYYVIKESPADEAGLREGDVITAIDQHPASAITLERIRRLFKQRPGESYTLSVLRHEQALDARIQLRRLI